MRILDEFYQKELIGRLKQGDESAFNVIYQAYSKPIYLKVLRMVKDKTVADELIQELFIKLWDKRHQLDIEKSFQSYIYTIAQNLVYNHFRKLASDQTLIQTLLQNSEHYLNTEKWLENKEAADLIKEAIDQLSPQRKRVFNLCKMEGKSYEETSQLIGISIATVNSHITQSLKAIKSYVLKHQGSALVLLSIYLSSKLFK